MYLLELLAASDDMFGRQHLIWRRVTGKDEKEVTFATPELAAVWLDDNDAYLNRRQASGVRLLHVVSAEKIQRLNLRSTAALDALRPGPQGEVTTFTWSGEVEGEEWKKGKDDETK